jgi:hypothetical protein
MHDMTTNDKIQTLETESIFVPFKKYLHRQLNIR